MDLKRIGVDTMEELLLNHKYMNFFQQPEAKKWRKREHQRLFREVFGPLLKDSGFISRANAFVRLYGDGILQLIGLGYGFERVSICVKIRSMKDPQLLPKGIEYLMKRSLEPKYGGTLDILVENDEVELFPPGHSGYFDSEKASSFEVGLKKYLELFERKALPILNSIDNAMEMDAYEKNCLMNRRLKRYIGCDYTDIGAVALAEQGRYDEAERAFIDLLNYSDGYFPEYHKSIKELFDQFKVDPDEFCRIRQKEYMEKLEVLMRCAAKVAKYPVKSIR